jgi:MFS family permease
MERERVSTEAGTRARRAAVAAIALALAVDAAYLLLLPTWHKAGQGAWQVLEVARAYPGLAAPDIALAAILLATLLVLTLISHRRPQLVAGLWALAGLTMLVASAVGAWILLAAIDNQALLSGAGEWRAVSAARLFVLAALLAAQCVAAALLLVAARLALARDWSWMGVRCLLALPLAWGVYAGLIEVAWAFSLPTDGSSTSLVNAAIGLAPAVAYAVAALILLTDEGGNGLLAILLACGAALSLFYISAWWQYSMWPELLVASLGLSAVAGGLLFVRRGRRQAVAR